MKRICRVLVMRKRLLQWRKEWVLALRCCLGQDAAWTFCEKFNKCNFFSFLRSKKKTAKHFIYTGKQGYASQDKDNTDYNVNCKMCKAWARK